MNIFLDFWPVFTNLSSEKNELTARFMTIFTDFGPERNEPLALFLLTIFSNLRPEESKLIARPKKSEFIAQFSPFTTIIKF